MLKLEEVVPFLLGRRLIDEEQIVDGALAVTNVSRRNHNFKIINRSGRSYFIKQGVGPEKSRTVAHEADVYLFLQSIAHANQMLRVLPRFFGYEPNHSILILELAPDAQSLIEYHGSSGRFSKRLASAIGNALGVFHRLTGNAKVREQYSQRHSSHLPFGLHLHRPDLSLFKHASQGCLEVVKMIQQSKELSEFLDSIRNDWRIETLIHGDLRLDNCNVLPVSSSGRRTRVRIVDWELATLGDPCWDVGTVFSEYLSLWLQSAPISGATPPEQFVKFARNPIERMQPAIRSFWQSYLRQLEHTTDRADEKLLRSVNYSAARLVQTAFERVQEGFQITGQAVCLLQLSMNILKRPHEASVQLLGIP
jgi:hypothetical protein